MKQREELESPCLVTDDEINLVDLFLIVWRHRWMVIAVTVLVTVTAAGISMVMPKVYAVSTIFEPAKDADDKLIENPQSIRENIVSGAYGRLLMSDLDLTADEIPKYKVTVPKQTDLVKIVIESSDPDMAVRILDSLLTYIKKEIAKQLEVKKQFLQNELKSAEAEKNWFPAQIEKQERLISVTQQLISDLEKNRKKLKSESSADSMMTLLYLNEIQNKQVFLSELYEKVSKLKAEDEQAAATIRDLQLKLTTLKSGVVRKLPEVSDKPIKPKKTLIVALAFILGLMGSVMLAFFAEFMVKVRDEVG
jgi:uncharacterized protein involved in exopolysaccharide biosynthesis